MLGTRDSFRSRPSRQSGPVLQELDSFGDRTIEVEVAEGLLRRTDGDEWDRQLDYSVCFKKNPIHREVVGVGRLEKTGPSEPGDQLSAHESKLHVEGVRHAEPEHVGHGSLPLAQCHEAWHTFSVHERSHTAGLERSRRAPRDDAWVGIEQALGVDRVSGSPNSSMTCLWLVKYPLRIASSSPNITT